MPHSEAHLQDVPLRTLLSAMGEYLERHEPWPGIAQLIGDAALVAPGDGASLIPTCTCVPLDGMIDALQCDSDAPGARGAGSQRSSGGELTRVLQCVAVAAPELIWRQNPNYVDAAFLARYAYCELIGPAGHAFCSSLSAGLLYLAAETHYPPHAHPAEEAYHLLSGNSRWQQGDQPARWLAPGARVLHPSGIAHSMYSGAQPMLALYLWRGDLGSAARLT